METRELTNELLRSKMTDAMVYRGVCQDLDAFPQRGVWFVSHATKNRPEGTYYGVLKVFQTEDVIEENLTSLTTNEMFFRIINRVGEIPFPAWRKVASSVVS